MNDLVAVLVVTLSGALLTAACASGFSRREKQWIRVSFLMHLGFACMQVPLTLSFYGGGDMFLYFRYGEVLAQLMNRDALHAVPEVTALLLQQSPRLPFEVIGAGSSTGSMSALAAWSFYLLGPSKYATCIAFAMLSLSGKLAMYRVFRANVDTSHRWYAALATLFIPSFVFWSSGLIKEAVALTGLGWSLLGIHLIIREKRLTIGMVLLLAGAIPTALIKAYLLFPLVLAAGSWYYWARSVERGGRRIRPARLVVAAAICAGGIVLLGHYFPDYSVDTLSARTAELQRLGRVVKGGSSYTLGTEIPTTLAGQFAYAPGALLSALFRPAIFEVHNVLMLFNALETTVLTLLLVRIGFTRSLLDVRRQILARPFLVFCMVFVLAFGLAVGLASSNLGTLSRYRAPLLPFFTLLLLVLGKREPALLPVEGSEPGPSIRSLELHAEGLSRVAGVPHTRGGPWVDGRDSSH